MRLFIMLLSACALVIGENTYAEDVQTAHEQAIAAIRKLGGTVVVDSQKPNTPVVVVLTGSSSPSHCLPYLKDVNNLHTCDL
jgi:hypothetical protein